jgi:hypothetical protein
VRVWAKRALHVRARNGKRRVRREGQLTTPTLELVGATDPLQVDGLFACALSAAMK